MEDRGRTTEAIGSLSPLLRRSSNVLVALLLFTVFALAGFALAATVIGGGLAGPATAEQPTFAERFAAEFAPADKPLKAGDAAPDFSLQDLNGETVTLSQLRGRPILINFWATWCGPCRVEMPEIEAAYRKYRDRGFAVLAVDVQEPPEDVRAFVAEMGLSFVPLLDTTGEVFGLYKVLALPTSYWIDRQGRISAVHLGPMTGEQIRGYVEGLLAQP